LNRLLAFAIVLSFVVFLTGCHSDEKQAAKIHKIMEESAEFENNFAANQTDLYETRKNAQLVYIDLISLDINDKDIIKQKIDKANTYTKKQQKLLEEAEENFQKAYKKSVTIEKNIKKIKDEDQKNQASKLITIMNERKELIDTFFEDYRENLELQNTFYRHLEDEKFSFENLDEQINDINKRSQDMGEIIQQFNQYTQQYIEVENDYYQMI
jgi:Putative cell-wall binding lipoprotein